MLSTVIGVFCLIPFNFVYNPVQNSRNKFSKREAEQYNITLLLCCCNFWCFGVVMLVSSYYIRSYMFYTCVSMSNLMFWCLKTLLNVCCVLLFVVFNKLI